MLNSVRDVEKSSISHAFYTYAHINVTTNKVFYIGKGSKKRYKSTNKRSAHWNGIVNKYGFHAEILAHWDTEKEAFNHEKLLISCFKNMGYKLANKTDGGEGTASNNVKKSALNRPKRILSEEHKAKISASGKGRIFSENSKNKISVALKGNTNGLGKKCSDEKKKKISNATKGRVMSEESRLKMIATKLAKRGKL
jgi:hypothetical protein